jgi:similar to spore coat protein
MQSSVLVSKTSGGKIMNTLLQNIMRMGGMTDQVIATDFLISAKSGVRNYASAITKVATPELKAAL